MIDTLCGLVAFLIGESGNKDDRGNGKTGGQVRNPLTPYGLSFQHLSSILPNQMEVERRKFL